MSKFETFFYVIRNACWNKDHTKIEYMMTEYVAGQTDTTVSIFPHSMFTVVKDVTWAPDPKERLTTAIKTAPKEYLWSNAARHAVRRGITGELTVPTNLTDKDVTVAYIKDLTTKDDKPLVRYTIGGVSGQGKFDRLQDVLEYIVCKYSKVPKDYNITFPKSLLGIAASQFI